MCIRDRLGSVHQQEDREEHEKWNLESNAKSMMTRLGIYNFDEPVGHLSGGQRKRLALVAVLLTPCLLYTSLSEVPRKR